MKKITFFLALMTATLFGAQSAASAERHFTIDGNFADWEDLTGLAHAEVSGEADFKDLYAMRWYADDEVISFYLEANADAKIVENVNILLSVDDDPLTGYNVWFWDHAAADYYFSGKWTNLADALLWIIDSDSDGHTQDNVGSILVDKGYLSACAPVVLTNGHAAVEGQIKIADIPVPVKALRVGVYILNDAYTQETGCLPQQDGPLLEVSGGSISTAIETAVSNTRTRHKFLRNGMLLILRDGVLYNAQGAEVR